MTLKIISFTIILTAISSALEITLNSPESAALNEEFTVSIQADTSETYDVKVFVHNSEDPEIKSNEYISEIYKDKWSNPWFYLKEVYPSQTEYKIKVIESPGEREICARLRKSGADSFKTFCQLITITGEELPDKEEINDGKSNEVESIETEDEESAPQDNNQESPESHEQPFTDISLDNNEKIILNSQQPTNTPQQKVLITKQEKIRIAIIYSFTFLCIIIIILLSLRKL